MQVYVMAKELDVLGLLSIEGSCRVCLLSLIIYAYIINFIIYAYEWQLSNSEQDPYTLNKLNTSNSRAAGWVAVYQTFHQPSFIY